MSPKGSMNTVVELSRRAKEDWPYHSTCMLHLRFGVGERKRTRPTRGAEGRLVGMPVASATHQRCGRGDEAGDDRERERLLKSRAEWRRDEMREERPPGDGRLRVGAQAGEHVRPEQVLDRVVAEER